MLDQSRSRIVQVVLAAAFFAIFVYLSFLSGVMSGWSVPAPGLRSLQSSAGPLAVSAVMGLTAVAGTRLIMGWRLLSSWLLLGLVIPALFALDTLV